MVRKRDAGDCTVAWCPGKLTMEEQFDPMRFQMTVVMLHVRGDGSGVSNGSVSCVLPGDELLDEMLPHVVNRLAPEMVDLHHSNTRLFDDAVRSRYAGSGSGSYTGILMPSRWTEMEEAR